VPSLHKNAQLTRHSKQSGNVMIYLAPFLSTITGSQQYWPLQLTKTISITHNSHTIIKIILHTNSSLLIHANDIKDLAW